MTRPAHTISPSREPEENTVSEQAPAGLEYKTLALAEVPLRLQVKSVTLAEPAGPGTSGAVNAPYEYEDENGNHIGVAESFVAVTGVRDKVGDIIPPGSFKRTLSELEPKACLGHDWNRPIGYPESIEEWLPGDPRLPEKKVDGSPWPEHAGVLCAITRYNLDTEDGRRAYSDAKFFGPQRTAWSIGYVPSQTKTRRAIDPHTGLPTRYLHDLDLYEYSQVLHGAHPMALSQSIKSGKPDDIETKARYVQDSAYWGYPVGTPIRPGMRPRGATARRIRQQGRTPSPNQGVTTDAPKPEEKPKGTRAKPDKITAAADAEALIPEPESEARVRAENPKGKDAEYVAQLAMNEDGTLDGEPQDNRDKAFRGLLAEGITPNELREDLAAVEDNEHNTASSVLEPEDIDDLVEEYTARYNALAKRQARQRRGEPEEEGGESEEQTPAAADQGEAPAGVAPEEEGAAAEEEGAAPEVSLDKLVQMPKRQAAAVVADLDDDTLAAFESELAGRAAALGKPGQRSNAHQAVADEIAKRAAGGGASAGTPVPKLNARQRDILINATERDGQWWTRAHANSAYPMQQAGLLGDEGSKRGDYPLTEEGVRVRESLAGSGTTPASAPSAADKPAGETPAAPDADQPASTVGPAGEAALGKPLAELTDQELESFLTGSREELLDLRKLIAQRERSGATVSPTLRNGLATAEAHNAELEAESARRKDSADEQRHNFGVKPGETDPDAQAEQRIAAVMDSLAEPGEWVRIADLRATSLSDDMGEEELTRQLQRLGKTSRFTLAPDPNGRAITPADRQAAVMIGGDENHLISREPDDEVLEEETPEGAPEGTTDGADIADGEELPGEAPSIEAGAEDMEGDIEGVIAPEAGGGSESDLANQVDAYRALDDEELEAEAERLQQHRDQLSDEGLDTYDSAMQENDVAIRAVEAVRAERAEGAAPEADSPETVAIISADEIADAEEVADAGHGVTEADDGEFEVDDDVAARQERVAGMLAQSEAGALDFNDRTPDQLHADRADVVAELRLQTHMEARRRQRERGQPPAQTTGSTADGADQPEQDEPEDQPPRPPVRPGVAGAAEDFADALESGDTDAITRTRARLASSLRRSRSDTEPIKALRALMDGAEDPTPEQLRAAAEAIRTDTRARRNEAARSRRTARRFERDRLRSLLGRIESAMLAKGMDFDALPEDAPDSDLPGVDSGALPGDSGRAAGNWVQKVDTIQWSGQQQTVAEVEGSNYRASVYAPQDRPASYEWEVTGTNGETIAKGDGAAPDAQSGQAAVEIALSTQAKLGNLPPDAHLPVGSIPEDTSARPVAEVDAAMDAVRMRLAMPSRSLNPITGRPDPMTGQAVNTRPPTTRAFETPEQVRRHLEQRATGLEGNSRYSLDTVINSIRWDDVQFTPGARFMVAQRAGSKGYELISTTHGIRLPIGTVLNGSVPSFGKADTLRAGALFESIRADNGEPINWTAPNEEIVPAIKAMTFGEHGDGVQGMQNAVLAALAQEKLKAGKWTDKLVQQLASGARSRNGVTNWVRHNHAQNLGRTLAIQIGGGFDGNKALAEDRKTLAIAKGAELLTDMGAPDEAAVLLRRRAAELREQFGAEESSQRGAALLEELASSYLAMHSPVRSPGERALNLRTGERVILPAGDRADASGETEDEALRSLRALTPMRKEGAYGGSSALVVDESNGQQYEIRIGNAMGGGQRLSVYTRGASYPEYATDLGASTFVVVGRDEPVPASKDELRGLANADSAIFGQNILDAAAEALPETAVEQAARRGAAPEGGRAPRRGSARAPRRTAPAQQEAAPVPGVQHLAAAQAIQRRALLGMDFSLADEAGPGGFESLEDVRRWATERIATFPAVEVNVRGSEPFMLQYMVDTHLAPDSKTRLSPGGHFLISNDHLVVHTRTGGAVWGMSSQQENYTDPTADSAMMVADYLERGRFDGVAMDWTASMAALKRNATAAMKSNALPPGMHGFRNTPSTIAARAAITDMLGSGSKAPKVADLEAAKSYAAATGGLDSAPNPDRYDLFGSRMVASRYAALAGVRVQGAEMLPASTKAGERLAKRARAELNIAEALAVTAPLDAVRRLNRVADSIGDETITDTDGKSFSPAEDLRALATRITDTWDADKPSPLGRLLANDREGVLTVNDTARIEAAPIYGTSSQAADAAAERINAKLDQAGRQITLRRNEEGTLEATFGDVTIVPRSGADDRIDINNDGSISLYWRVRDFGRMHLRLPPGSWDVSDKPAEPEEEGAGEAEPFEPSVAS